MGDAAWSAIADALGAGAGPVATRSGPGAGRTAAHPTSPTNPTTNLGNAIPRMLAMKTVANNRRPGGNHPTLGVVQPWSTVLCQPDPISVCIFLLWGDDALSVTSLRRGQRYGLALPEDLLGTATPDLVTPGRPWPRLFVPPQADGWLSAPGSAPRRLRGMDSASLVLGCRARLELGPFTVLISCTTIGFRFPARSALDRRWRTSVALTAAAQVALLSALSRAAPALGDTEDVPLERTPPVHVGASSDAPAESELEDPAPEVALEPGPFLYAAKGARCGDLFEMGRPGAPPSGRYGVEGPKDNPDPHIERARGPRGPSAQEALAQRDGEPAAGADRDPHALTAPWGRDTSLGTDEVSARGNLWGDQIEPAEGQDTLGRLNVEGGLVKRIGIGGPSSERSRPRVVHTGLALSGPLGMPEVERTITPSFARFLDCYEAGRAEDPKLEGRVDIRFVIQQDGSIRDVRTAHTTLGSRVAESCLEASFRELSFPRSARGETTVIYPLFFVPGSSPPQVLGGGITHTTDPPVPCSRTRPSRGDDSEPPEKPQPCAK
jgi:hypothetical protein